MKHLLAVDYSLGNQANKYLSEIPKWQAVESASTIWCTVAKIVHQANNFSTACNIP